MSQEETLLFVSNSNSGVLPQIKNYSDHLSASHSEGCHLSALTYSPVGMKKEWKRFIREQKIPSRALDREEFRAEFGSIAMTFPVVLVRTRRGLSVLISTDELNRCRSLEDLMNLLQQRLAPIP
ncbi:hypothetical protein [Methanoregula sp.]|uniref:hypothetical protein n=1 Tax=Methanoregula sp. TaxID=2052170 RepID=UPI003561299D